MATIGTGFTILDIARRIGGDQEELVNAVTDPNDGAVVMRHLPMKPVQGWVEKFTRLDGRPTVAWRKLGEYISSSKANINPYSEGIFLLSGLSIVDKIRADGDPRGVDVAILEEDMAFLEAMGHQLDYDMFYGKKTTDDQFDGLLTRLATGFDGVVAAGGATAICSIYAFKLGPKEFMGLYNTGATGGKLVNREPVPGGWRTDVSSSTYNQVYETWYNAAFGIAQYHPHSIGRIAGIEASNKPTQQDFTDLYSGMKGKPDLLATTWRGWGYLAELLSGKQSYPPGADNYAPYLQWFDGIPVVIDTALSDAEETL